MSRPKSYKPPKKENKKPIIVRDRDIIDAVSYLGLSPFVGSLGIDLKEKKIFLKSFLNSKDLVKKTILENIVRDLNQKFFTDYFYLEKKASITYDKEKDAFKVSAKMIDPKRLTVERKIATALNTKKVDLDEIPYSRRALPAIMYGLDCVPNGVDPSLIRDLLDIEKETKEFVEKAREFVKEHKFSRGSKHLFDYVHSTVSRDGRLALILKSKEPIGGELSNMLEELSFGSDVELFVTDSHVIVPDVQDPKVFLTFCAAAGFVPVNELTPLISMGESRLQDLAREERKTLRAKKIRNITSALANFAVNFREPVADFSYWKTDIHLLNSNVNDHFFVYLDDIDQRDKEEVETLLRKEGVSCSQKNGKLLEVSGMSNLLVLYKTFKVLGFPKAITGVPYRRMHSILSNLVDIVEDPTDVIERTKQSFGLPDEEYRGSKVKYSNGKIIIEDKVKNELIARGYISSKRNLWANPSDFNKLCEVLQTVPEVEGLSKEEIACLTMGYW